MEEGPDKLRLDIAEFGLKKMDMALDERSTFVDIAVEPKEWKLVEASAEDSAQLQVKEEIVTNCGGKYEQNEVKRPLAVIKATNEIDRSHVISNAFTHDQVDDFYFDIKHDASQNDHDEELGSDFGEEAENESILSDEFKEDDNDDIYVESEYSRASETESSNESDEPSEPLEHPTQGTPRARSRPLHHDSQPMCTMCDWTTKYPARKYMQHMRTAHKVYENLKRKQATKDFTCSFCSYNCETIKRLIKHSCDAKVRHMKSWNSRGDCQIWKPTASNRNEEAAEEEGTEKEVVSSNELNHDEEDDASIESSDSEKLVESRSDRSAHMRVFHEDLMASYSWKCLRCSMCFDTQTEWRKHLASQHEKLRKVLRVRRATKPFQCPICNTQCSHSKFMCHLKTKHTIFENILTKSKEERPSCTFCATECENLDALLNHCCEEKSKRMAKHRKVLYCNLCENWSINRSESQDHATTHYVHNESMGFRCVFCGKYYKRRKHLMRHLNTSCTGNSKSSYPRRTVLVNADDSQICEKYNNLEDLAPLAVLKTHLETCNKCEEIRYGNELIEPIFSYDSKRNRVKHVCRKCGKRISNHQKTQSSINNSVDLSRCISCKVNLPTKELYKSHFQNYRVPVQSSSCNKNESSVQYFACNNCDALFHERHVAWLHNLTHTVNDHCTCVLPEPHLLRPCQFLCDVCGKGFRTKHCLDKHQVRHSENSKKLRKNLPELQGDFACNKCRKAFESYEQYKQHFIDFRDSYTPGVFIPCHLCSKLFHKECHAKTHVKLVHGIKHVNTCGFCSESFLTYQAKAQHVRSVHLTDKIVTCETCGLSFTNKHSFKKHQKGVHAGEKAFKCLRCEKAFFTAELLIKHERVHTNEKPFECSQCERKFASSANLQLHLRIHSGEKPYTCSYCEKGFANHSNYTTHLRYHERVMAQQ